ncbi:MAG: flavodoxin domain-containing protein [Candidatus Lokiarchaeota archaeon]|nr:flavodoxin domain-containing protein [Candidatus Lokiarchaeota archaeon]
MKILVTYYSQTGNTEQIAKVIHKIALKNHESELKKVSKVDVKDVIKYDVVFLGSACHDSDLAKPVLRFLKGIPKSPNFKLAGFFTHSTNPPEGSERNKKLYEKWAGKCHKTFEKFKLKKDIDFNGYFRCQGAPSPPIEKFIHETIFPDDDEWKEYIDEAKKHPNKTDIENAKNFATDILKKCQSLE